MNLILPTISIFSIGGNATLRKIIAILRTAPEQSAIRKQWFLQCLNGGRKLAAHFYNTDAELQRIGELSRKGF